MTSKRAKRALPQDVRLTPRWLFDAFDAPLAFTLDAAASPDNALCSRYIDEQRDALNPHLDWVVEAHDGAIWCNPPFSLLGPFAHRAAEAGTHVPVAFVMPGNRWEQQWCHDTVLTSSTYIVAPLRRVAYGGSGKSPEWPSVVVVWLPGKLGVRQLITLASWNAMWGR
jgi:hypothetical protein